MTALVRVLTVSAVDSSPSLLLISPNGSKILVNCGEGCQRAFLEFSQRISTVKAVCLTHLGHSTTGGLPGAILSLADTKTRAREARPVRAAAAGPLLASAKPTSSPEDNDQLCLVGPRGTQKYVESLRHFMNRPNFHVSCHESNVVDLQVSKQHKKKSWKSNKKSNRKYDPIDPLDFSIETMAVDYVEEGSQKIGSSRKRPRPEPIRREILSYVFRTPPIPGTFLIDKAIALGIPKGPLYRQLKSGKSVTFQDTDGKERSVEPSEVVAPSSPSVAVQVLYYPTKEIATELFEKAKSKAQGTNLELVVHIAPPDLFHEIGLPYWKDLADNVFLTTDRTGESPYRSAIVGGCVRALLSPEIYQSPTLGSPATKEDSPTTFRRGEPLLEYVVLPLSKRGFENESPKTTLNPSEVALEQFNLAGVADAAKNLARKVEESSSVAGKSAAEIIFTGTGSSIPCRHRNVSGILLRQLDGQSILLDAGEGTIGQLLRMKDAGFQLSSIVAAFISHPHADHHLGLVRLLEDRVAAEPLLLIAPTPIFRFLEEYEAIEPSISGKYCAIDNRDLENENSTADQELYNSTGIRARTVSVAHCQHSYGVVLDHTSFGRVVYSGDCRPSRRLVAAGRRADVLIHEATFEDGMEAEAVLKRHSTIGEALCVGKDMQAKHVVLTHFSQRYPRLPHLSPEHDTTITIAFDFLCLSQSHLSVAPLMNPALRLLYPEYEDEIGEHSNAETKLSVPGLFANSDML